ncbi:hypothetical protein GALMADRAFT_136873 [Galerina marginata CBS 339.88]|uniref:Uncharacterized protein n=1 Tax=Galerina marginata (strain CBS 339.88) TaxID=685588 RepID=A0A067TDG1_GALM3|nr:hypothetical protein GALMADRAFT_136873 [Galerina marginata CBS 339.88]
MLWTRCEKAVHDRRLKESIQYLTEAHGGVTTRWPMGHASKYEPGFYHATQWSLPIKPKRAQAEIQRSSSDFGSPSLSSDAYNPSHGTISAGVHAVDRSTFSALTKETNGQNPIFAKESTSRLYNRNANGSSVGHQSFRESSQQRSKNILRYPPQSLANESRAGNSSWNEKNARTQQSIGRQTSRQNSNGGLHAFMPSAEPHASNPIVYDSLPPSAPANSRDERDSPMQSTTASAYCNGASNRSNGTRLFGHNS